MRNLSFKDILDRSVHLFPSSLAVWPQYDYSEELVVMDWDHIYQYEMKYCASNNVVQFVYHGNLYADVWEYNVIEILESQGFHYADMYVNFSGGDFPRDERFYWFARIKEARDCIKESFADECRKFYERRGIREVSDAFMGFCYEIPEEGIEIVTIKKDKLRIFPPKHYASVPLDMNIIWLLGVYDVANGIVTFITTDGRQMIASVSSGIMEELERCGYEREPRYVPLANGEKVDQSIINDLIRKDIWI